MRRLNAALLAVVLAATACGGSTPAETEQDGIAALDEKGDEGTAEPKSGGGRTKGQAGTKKPATKKPGGTKAGPGATAQTAGGGSSGSNGSGGGSGGGGSQPQRQAAPAPVPQGEYRYDTEGSRTISGNTSDLPKVTTLTAGAPSNGTQRQARDLRDSEGNGTLTETDLVYGPGGVSLSYVKVTSRFQGGITDVREFKLARPQLIAPAGGGPGFKGSFTMKGSGTTAKVSITAHRWENVPVSGEQVRALMVETDIRFSGALEGYQRTIAWIWPKHLLTLKEQVETDVRNGPIRLQSTYQAQIQQI